MNIHFSAHCNFPPVPAMLIFRRTIFALSLAVVANGTPHDSSQIEPEERIAHVPSERSLPSHFTSSFPFDSDLLVIHPSPSIYFQSNHNISSINLYTSHPVHFRDFLCEFRGNILPLQDIHETLPFLDPSYILTSFNGIKYYLFPNTVCALVNDCIDLSLIYEEFEQESDYYYPACRPNAYLNQHSGKLYLVASSDLPIGTELFVFRGVEYWRTMMRQLGYVTHPSNLPIPATLVDTVMFDSDQLNLFTAPSLLPGNIGMGIFAKYDIAPNTILCEYRGPTYPLNSTVSSNKWSSILLVNDLLWKSAGVGFCSIINDPSLIQSYTREYLDRMFDPQNPEEIPLHAGFSPNVVRASNGPKSFVMSSHFIHAGAELFYPYGK
jgi:hypothetical protein